MNPARDQEATAQPAAVEVKEKGRIARLLESVQITFGAIMMLVFVAWPIYQGVNGQPINPGYKHLGWIFGVLIGVTLACLALYWFSYYWVLVWLRAYDFLTRFPLLAAIIAVIGIGLLGWYTFAAILLGLVISVFTGMGIVLIGKWLEV